ncbi:type IV toxin-antitoxin system AbiEi family antitoxin domain-containing protein [Pseudomonas sp. NFXW11]|uniref:type IV toxin-antitoxin system AbiEi family antitoxin domain-containing protein n=1 Tax=Pseudomonas sp. NFXW11 TaxID=2819531 RepID=UPI003CFB95A7
MSERNYRKLNQLLEKLGDSTLVTSRWLREHGYASNLVARYVASGWLESPARGVYLRKGGHLSWQGVVRTLQQAEGLALHVGGRFALAWRGHEHYLRLGAGASVTLYGPEPIPAWVGKLSLKDEVVGCSKGPFDFPALQSFTEVTDNELRDRGLERVFQDSQADGVVFSTPERAMLELCDAPASADLVYEADALMQGLANLRPKRVEALLRNCCSIKAKRLFLALAQRHGHAWLSHVSLEGIYLGRGKRSLVPGGRLHPIYHITLPVDLDEQLG